MEYSFLVRFKVSSSLLSQWYDSGHWSAKKYRSWIHFSGPIPIFSVAVQGDWLCRSSQPRHCKRASQLTNGKGSGTQANWQAEGAVEKPVLPLQILKGFRTASQAKYRQQHGASQYTHVSKRLSSEASVGSRYCTICLSSALLYSKYLQRHPRRFNNTVLGTQSIA